MSTAAGQRRAQLQQAERLYAARHFGEAEAICRNLVSQHPADVGARLLLARLALDKGLHDEAAGHLERCVQISPRDPEVRLALAQVRLKAGQLEQAEAAFDHVLRLRPGHLGAVTGKAGVLDRGRRRDEALELLMPFVAARREDIDMAALLARLATQAGKPDLAIEVASRHARDRAAAPGPLRSLLFQLGAALEEAGRYDEAFASYERANALLKLPYDPRQTRARMERLMEICSRATLEALPRSADQSELPVFVIGMPRSATTLVDRIIDAHPRAAGGGELDILPQIADELSRRIGSNLGWPECIRDLDEGDVSRLSQEYLAALRRVSPEARRIADKQLGNDQTLGLASLLVPRARVIHCRRDPMDTCFSCFAHALAPTLHPYASDLSWLGHQYRLVERLLLHWRATLDLPWLTVEYEDLVEHPEPATRRIIEFCGLEWDERCLRFHEAAGHAHTLSYDQVRRPVYRSSVGRAKHFEAHLGPLREALQEGV